MAWSPLQELVTLTEAKQHLRIPAYDSPSAEDDDLQLKLEIAHELVMDYLTQRMDDDNQEEWQDEVDAWTTSTVPKRVKGAILFEFGRLYRHRGDDDDRTPGDPLLARETRILLDRFRDPVL